MATKIIIEPIFEADFEACSYGFRPKKSATQAMEAIREAGNQGYNVVIDADIRGYFDSIDQEKLLVLVRERISDRRVEKLIRQWLRAGVMEDHVIWALWCGTPTTSWCFVAERFRRKKRSDEFVLSWTGWDSSCIPTRRAW